MPTLVTHLDLLRRVYIDPVLCTPNDSQDTDNESLVSLVVVARVVGLLRQVS